MNQMWKLVCIEDALSVQYSGSSWFVGQITPAWCYWGQAATMWLWCRGLTQLAPFHCDRVAHFDSRLCVAPWHTGCLQRQVWHNWCHSLSSLPLADIGQMNTEKCIEELDLISLYFMWHLVANISKLGQKKIDQNESISCSPLSFNWNELVQPVLSYHLYRLEYHM